MKSICFSIVFLLTNSFSAQSTNEIHQIVDSAARIVISTAEINSSNHYKDDELSVVSETQTNEPFVFVERMPEFPGGDESLFKFIKSKIKYPLYAIDNKIEGTVLVNFIVNEDGSISNAKITKGIKGGCDQEALRVVKLLPKWKPGMQGGKAVKVYFDIPITFKL